MGSDLCISPLGAEFNRHTFDCTIPELNDFLRKRARKHEKQGMSVTYVLHRDNELDILGFYAISMAEIKTNDMQNDLVKELPHHPVPAVRIGRLAVAKAQQEKGYGSALLWDAIERSISLSDEIGARAIEAHAKNDQARAFYLRHGFISLVDDKNHLYLSMDTARKVLEYLEKDAESV